MLLCFQWYYGTVSHIVEKQEIYSHLAITVISCMPFRILNIFWTFCKKNVPLACGQPSSHPRVFHFNESIQKVRQKIQFHHLDFCKKRKIVTKKIFFL